MSETNFLFALLVFVHHYSLNAFSANQVIYLFANNMINKSDETVIYSFPCTLDWGQQMDPGAGPSHSVSEFYAALALEWKPILTSSRGAFFSASCKSQQSIKKLHNEICKSITQFLKCYCKCMRIFDLCCCCCRFLLNLMDYVSQNLGNY